MIQIRKIRFARSSFYFFIFCTLSVFARNWECQVLPSERKEEIDPKSGAKIIFITTNEAQDNNLYFHDRCWLLNNNLMLFYSDRTGKSEIFGYIAQTGELVRFNNEEDAPAHSAVASRKGDRFYIVREGAVFQWTVDLKMTPRTQVKISEEKICDYPSGSSQLSGLNENSDQTLVSFGYKLDNKPYIAVAEIETGETQVVAQAELPIQHIQFSWTRPNLLSFAGSYGGDTAPLDPKEPPHCRIWLANVNTRTTLPVFYQKPGELVTHECWWVHDQITFIGGHKVEEAHVKVLDIKTGEIRIIGAGAWWEGATVEDISQVNWWHAAGSPNGRWVAADNWHGIIALFNAKTTEMRILTTGHRTYGRGAHPHVSWDLTGESVEFTSNKWGNPDVCIGIIPEEW
jgi:oligogalacturonide lyase